MNNVTIHPTISVIIPVYNTEKYLRRCLDSIVAQTCENFECILVDDGSTDDSGKICDEYADKDSRFKAYHNENGGPSKERNFGLEHSKGEYVLFIDSDDWLEKDAINNYAKAIKEYHTDIVKSGYEIDHPNNKKNIYCVDKVIVPSNKVDLFLSVEKSGYTGFIWNAAFKRSAIGNLRFSETIKWCEDQLFSLEMFNRCNSIVLIPHITYHYMVGQGESLSNVQDAQLVFDVTQKWFELKYKLAGNNKEAFCIMSLSYNNLVNRSLQILYNNKSLEERRSFKKRNFPRIRITNTHWQSRLYFSNIPFWLADILLVINVKYKSTKRDLKKAIKKLIK